MKSVIAVSALCGFLFFGVPGVDMHDSHASDHTVHVAHAAHVAHAGHAASQSRNCEYEAERRVELSASAGDRLVLTAGSGFLEIVGREGLDQVRVVGRVCTSHEEWIDELDVRGERRGSDAVIETVYPDRGNWRDLFRGRNYARIDLTVEVPAGMAVDLEDSSGEMNLQGLGDLRIDDSSGEIVINGSSGSVWIDDSSGEIEITGVVGDVEIDDGSGEIMLSDIDGSVMVSDGSGEIEVEGVTGNVVIRDDGSGSIEVDGVGGDFVVRSDGSGSIRYDDVQGEVNIPRNKRRRG